MHACIRRSFKYVMFNFLHSFKKARHQQKQSYKERQVLPSIFSSNLRAKGATWPSLFFRQIVRTLLFSDFLLRNNLIQGLGRTGSIKENVLLSRSDIRNEYKLLVPFFKIHNNELGVHVFSRN